MPNCLILEEQSDGALRTAFRRAEKEYDEAEGKVTGFASPFSNDDLEDLRWYLEEYLQIPFAVYEERGQSIQAKLGAWGRALFAAVFGPDQPGHDAYVKAREGECELLLRAASARFFTLPWELLQDPERTQPMALELSAIDRSVTSAGAAAPVPPGPDLRVLMVIARPHAAQDVGYQMIARPLLERLEAVSGQVTLDVLRPPTLEALVELLNRARDAGTPYHILHFDGHGTFYREMGAAAKATGYVIFENNYGQSYPVDASHFAEVVNTGQVPLIVLNACCSGTLGDKEVDAAVATQLLKGGAASVVAMGYSVYAVAAAEFTTSFYEALFAGKSVSAAVAEGRRRLYHDRHRPSQKGPLPLEDWIVPVHYQRRAVAFTQLERQAKPHGQLSSKPARPGANTLAAAGHDPLDANRRFIGRDKSFYELERALRKQRVVLVHGPAGTGKTELAKAFGRWWQATGGVDRPDLVFFHSFEPGVASFGLDGVVTEIGLKLFGPDFIGRTETADHRRDILLNAMRQHRMLLLWDNCETLHDLPDPHGATNPLDVGEQRRMRDFLDAACHGKSGVILTSRTPETWLGNLRRLPLGRLDATEAAELAIDVLKPFPSAWPKRETADFARLMEWLDGHPLSLRLVLPHLATYPAASLLQALDGSAQSLPPGFVGEGRLASLGASLQYSFDHVPPEERKRAWALALFEGAADEEVLANFSGRDGVPAPFAGVTKAEWSALLQSLAALGVLSEIGAGMYGLHPALPSYLMADWRRSAGPDFTPEREAADQALLAAYAAFGSWLSQQIAAGSAEMAFELIDRQRRTMGRLLGVALAQKRYGLLQAILQSLDYFWDTRGLIFEADDWAERCRAALEDASGVPPDPKGEGSALWRLVVTDAANRAYRAGKLIEAERIYEAIRRQLEPTNDPVFRSALAVVYNQLGMVAQHRGDLAAESWYRQSLAISDALGNRHGMAMSYGQLGRMAQDRGDLAAAESWYHQGLEILEALGNRPSMAVSYHNLGIVAQDSGDLAAAGSWYRQSLAILEALGNRTDMAKSYHQLSMVAERNGDLAEAESWSHQSLAIREALGDRPGMAHSYHQLGTVAYLRGDLAAAESWYRQSLAISEAFGNRPAIAISYQVLGNVALDHNDLAAAESWYRKSLAIGEALGNRPGMAISYQMLGDVALDRGDLAAAESWYRKSLAIGEALGNRPGLASIYGQMGVLCIVRGEVPAALDWMIRCTALFPDFPDPQTGPCPQHLARLAAELGMPALAAAWQRVTNAPLPDPIRATVEQMIRDLPPASPAA